MKFIQYSFFLAFLFSTNTIACNNASQDPAIDQYQPDNSINQHILYENLKEQLQNVQEDLDAIYSLDTHNVDKLRKKLEAKEALLLNQIKAIKKDASVESLADWQQIALVGGGLMLASALVLAIIIET